MMTISERETEPELRLENALEISQLEASKMKK
jgi:hypothetical protein